LELDVDITNGEQVEALFEKYTKLLGRPIDLVMHFGALIEVGESVKDPLRFYRNNVVGTVNVLEAMTRHQVKHIIFSSTAAIFGSPLRVPIQPHDTSQPINPYGETKLCVEKLLKACDEAYGIKYVALRYFNAAGAHESGLIGEDHHPESHLIPLILQVASGKREKIFIFGTDYDTRDGSCVRDYVHVSDLATAHVRAAEYLLKGGNSDVFNLGTNRGFTVKEVIEACRHVTGHEIPAEEAPRRPGDPDVLVASPDKAQKVLEWTIKYDNVQDIVRTAWNWHKNNPKGFMHAREERSKDEEK